MNINSRNDYPPTDINQSAPNKKSDPKNNNKYSLSLSKEMEDIKNKISTLDKDINKSRELYRQKNLEIADIDEGDPKFHELENTLSDIAYKQHDNEITKEILQVKLEKLSLSLKPSHGRTEKQILNLKNEILELRINMLNIMLQEHQIIEDKNILTNQFADIKETKQALPPNIKEFNKLQNQLEKFEENIKDMTSHSHRLNKEMKAAKNPDLLKERGRNLKDILEDKEILKTQYIRTTNEMREVKNQLEKFPPGVHLKQKQLQELDKKLNYMREHSTQLENKYDNLRNERTALINLSSSKEQELSDLVGFKPVERYSPPSDPKRQERQILKEEKLFGLEHANTESLVKHVNVKDAEHQRIAGRKFIKDEIAKYEQFMPLNYDKIKRKVTTDIDAISKESNDIDKYSVQMLKHELDKQIKAKKSST